MGQDPVCVATDFWKAPVYTEATAKEQGAMGIEKYILMAVFIRFLADFLLIMAVNRLTLQQQGIYRDLLGSAVSGLYAAGCTILQWGFLNHPVCYIVSLMVTCLLAFGVSRDRLSGWLLFCLLRLGLDGIGAGQGMMPELLGAFILCAVCLYGFRSNGQKRYVPVELCYGQRKVSLQALYDTGHQLRDPVTGKPVLVVGADVADKLAGLTPRQLEKPVETIGLIPGLRLIPYQTVGRSGDLMLALQLEQTTIGRKKGSYLVAFAPQVLDGKGQYQGLIGGNV